MKTYKFSGICMVPYEASLTVLANSELEAISKAEREFKLLPDRHIIPGSGDKGAAHSWVPFLEEASP